MNAVRPLTPADRSELAPTGRLRAAINFGNPVLAQRDPDGGAPHGVSPDLARRLAVELAVPIDYLAFDGAGQVFESAGAAVWDVAFLAIDPVRAAEIRFTPAYVVIEGTYLVPAASGLHRPADVDRPGVRIASGRGAAYDLHLQRALKAASLVRSDTSAAALDHFVAARLEAAAGVRQPLEAFAAARPGLYRVIAEPFTAIRQALGTPRGRVSGDFLDGFVERMKASGFVADALQRSGRADAVVAPAADTDTDADTVAP